MKLTLKIQNENVTIDTANNRIGIEEEVGEPYNPYTITRWFPIDILREALITIDRLKELQK